MFRDFKKSPERRNGVRMGSGAPSFLLCRSRPAGYRKPALAGLGELLGDRHLLELVRAGQDRYNRQAATLQRGTHDVLQVAVPDRAPLIGRLESDGGRVVEALRLGASAMASTLLTGAVDLCWKPAVYHAAAPEPSGPQREAPARRKLITPPHATGWAPLSDTGFDTFPAD